MKFGNENIEKIVFESTKNILLKRGVKGWNMDDLAKECGMSKRTLYKIIGSKEELLYRCYQDTFNLYAENFRKFIKQDVDYYTLLDNLSDQIANGIDEYVIASSKTIRTEYPQISKMIDEKIDIHHELIIAFIEKGCEKNLLRDDVNPKIIDHIVEALMSYNVMNSKGKADFEIKIKEQLKFLFEIIKK
ncbi:TetR/AcrR family transcriptional regulator [Marinifilum sp. RC60d5]|uniref:TetR/AcrR family transcriptional regulator n=1 Tax=Marinifilum sp. RC60d5 TaxID=3458414 RepID=UPI004036DA07